MKKLKLDQLLVNRGFIPSVDEAKRYIMAGKILIDDIVITQPGTLCNPQSRVRIKEKKSEFVLDTQAMPGHLFVKTVGFGCGFHSSQVDRVLQASGRVRFGIPASGPSNIFFDAGGLDPQKSQSGPNWPKSEHFESVITSLCVFEKMRTISKMWSPNACQHVAIFGNVVTFQCVLDKIRTFSNLWSFLKQIEKTLLKNRMIISIAGLLS